MLLKYFYACFIRSSLQISCLFCAKRMSIGSLNTLGMEMPQGYWHPVASWEGVKGMETITHLMMRILTLKEYATDKSQIDPMIGEYI